MVNHYSDLSILIRAYALGELSLAEMRDQIYLCLQPFAATASEEDMELLSEVLACVFEVEDGIMPEETFRQALTQFIKEHLIVKQKRFIYRKKLHRVHIRQHGYAQKATSKRKPSVALLHRRQKQISVRNKNTTRTPITRVRRTALGVVR